MVMRKTADAALIPIPQKDLKRFQDTIEMIKTANWKHAYSKAQAKMLLRRRSTGRWNAKVAADLEDGLTKALSEQAQKLIWAWSAGGEELYFPGTEIMVLFEEGTTQAERKRILRKIKGLRVQTYRNAEVKPRPYPKIHRSRRRALLPGFAKSKISQARRIWGELYPERLEVRRPERPSSIIVPVAKVSISEQRRDDIFEIAEEIKALPKVRAATPDVSVLGKNLVGMPQQADLPSTSNDSVHKRNRVDFAWRLVNPDDLAAPAGQFLASREKVAVIDSNFVEHPEIDYELIGYDAADQDQNPLTPTAEGSRHGLKMSGVIGGTGQDAENESGVAPGSVIIPIRPAWNTEDDFGEINGVGFYNDFEEYVARYTVNWVDTIIRLYQLSIQGVEIANMSLSYKDQLWDNATTDMSEWFNWWLREGNHGYGVFAAASAGNNAFGTTLAHPASVARVFAVGWGQKSTYNMLGNSGWGLELVVDDGRWPVYHEDGTIGNGSTQGGGSSVSSAVVAGTAAIMKSLNPYLSADEIKSILRLTTQKIPTSIAAPTAPTGTILQWPDEDNWDGWGPGYCTEFGNGFLDAHYAAEIAWRKHFPAAELLRVKYRTYGPGWAMIQLRHPPSSSLAGKRIGKFWSSYSYSSTANQRWLHDRDFRLEGIDQAVDLSELPFGEQIVVGDFDGDYRDEMALQLHYSEFWPDVTDHPAQSLLAFKFDESDERWKAMGKRSPYASGLAAPQVVFPPEQPPQEMLAADVKDDRRDCLIAWGGALLNALQYDESSDTFLRLDPVNFAPPLYSPEVDQATGLGNIVDQRILRVAPMKRGGSRELLVIVGSISKLGYGGIHSAEPQEMAGAQLPQYPDLPHLPGVYELPDFSGAGLGGASINRFTIRHYMTVSIIGYDNAASQWVNYSFSSNPNETHLLLDETATPYVEAVIQGKFGYPDDVTKKEIAIHLANDHIYTVQLTNEPGHTFSQTSVYRNELDLEGRISRLRAGRFGLDGEKTQLAWLGDGDHGNRVRFLQWNQVVRKWQPASLSVSHYRPDNLAIDLVVLKGFTYAGLDGDQDTIAIKMAEPDGNVFLTYRYQDPGAFYYMGLI